MKYKILIIVASAFLFTGCGQTKDFSANQIIHEPVDEPVNDFTAEEIKQIQFEAKMLAENGEPTFEELLKEAKKDGSGNSILTSEMRYLFSGCENTDAGFLTPNTTVLYENKERGIAFKVPYNSAWRFCGYVLGQYDEIPSAVYGDESGRVEFGPLQLMPESGGNLHRKFHLAFKSTTTPEILIAAHDDSLSEFKKIKINNLIVVRQYYPPPTDGMGCSSLSYYVFGEKATYKFGGYCVEMSIGGQKYSTDQFSKELEQIIKTVKLI